jgi:uracil-DNA glycosylase
MPHERILGIALPGPADFPAWRAEARRLLAAGVPPEGVEWRVAGETAGLFASEASPEARPSPHAATVPRVFLEAAEVAIRHRDPERFALLYRLLWRLARPAPLGEPALMGVPTDPEVARLLAMARAVRRDAHKMHAFLRFRRTETPEGGEHYIAWFEPEHHILEAETGFFLRRFPGMRWSILTPEASAHWDGEALRLGPGGCRADAPPDDAAGALWRAYYASIFNPARLKPMRAEMPRRYWRNLPETGDIPRMIADAPRRAAAMVARGATPPAPRRQRNVHLAAQPGAAPRVSAGMAADLLTAGTDPQAALAALREELRGSNSLPPWTANATQMVFGEGPVGAPLMFIGEQHGDEEDIAGRPFVGPAGRLFNRALEEAGVTRDQAYVTNAVKHFKFKPTGRRRLHQSPDAGDITRYRPFLKREVDIVAPGLVVTLGATALRAMTGKPLAITKVRGELIETPDGLRVFPTVHPSYLLRLPDPESKEREYARFVADLRAAKREVA